MVHNISIFHSLKNKIILHKNVDNVKYIPYNNIVRCFTESNEENNKKRGNQNDKIRNKKQNKGIR